MRNKCPTAESLAKFDQGKQSAAQAARIAAHLENCAKCQLIVDALPADSFVHKIRRAKQDDDCPSERERSGSAPDSIDLPQEFVNHLKFRIVREIGHGGMGVIYLAEHRVMAKLVALKVIKPSILDNPDALALFHDEVKSAGKLDHPNITRAYDADQAGHLHFLVMEFVEGLTLAQLLEQQGPLPVSCACDYIRQAALGLQHAHERGMIHRDIKLQNLMLTPLGLIKILDFGLALVETTKTVVLPPGESESATRAGCSSPRETEGQESCYTAAGSILGTPEFMAPEQAEDARKADTRSDIYSLGCTLYALLAGRPPFREKNVAELLRAHREKTPLALHEFRQDVSAELSAVVAKMLAKDPTQRYPTPWQVAQELERFGNDRLASPWKRPRLLAVTVCASLILAGLTAVSIRFLNPPTAGKSGTDADDARLSLAVATTALEPVGQSNGLVESKEGIVFPLRTLRGHKAWVKKLQFTADGKRLVSASNGNHFEPEVNHPGIDNSLRVWSVESGQEIRTFRWSEGLGYGPQGIGLSPDGQFVAACISWDWGRPWQKPLVCVWDISQGTRTQLIPLSGTRATRAVGFSADGKKLYVARSGSAVHAWSFADMNEFSTNALDGQGPDEAPLGVIFTPGCRHIIGTLFQTWTFCLWDRETGKQLRRFVGHAKVPRGFAMSPDGQRIVSCAADFTVRLWDAETGRELLRLENLDSQALCSAFSPDGKFFLTGHEDGSVFLRHAETGKALVRFAGQTAAVNCLAVSSEGRLLAAGGDDTTVCLWQLP